MNATSAPTSTLRTPVREEPEVEFRDDSCSAASSLPNRDRLISNVVITPGNVAAIDHSHPMSRSSCKKCNGWPAALGPYFGNGSPFDYYPITTGLRYPTKCNNLDGTCFEDTDLLNRKCGGTDDIGEKNCMATVLDHYITSFNFSEKNFSSIWMRRCQALPRVLHLSGHKGIPK